MSVLQRILKIWQEDYLHSFIVTLPGEGSQAASMLWLHQIRDEVQIKHEAKVIVIYIDVFKLRQTSKIKILKSSSRV